MSEHNNSSGGWRDDRGLEFNASIIKIRDTILMCRVDGMETTGWALHRIDQHLESIAQSLASIDRSLAVFAAAQTKPEEK